MTKKRILFSVFSVFIVFIITILLNPIIGKYLTGTARIIGKDIKCEIYIDGKKKTETKLFESKSNFTESEKRDYLILYLREEKDFNGIPVLIIDKKNGIVKIPNASKKDYNLVFGNLLQSDSGANVMISINDKLKGMGCEPNLIITKNNIEFEILMENKIQKIKINIA